MTFINIWNANKLKYILEAKKWKTSTDKSQEKDKDELTDEILKLKQELRDANVNVEIAKANSNNSVNVSNVDILKRLSNLENAIFGRND